MCLNRGRYAGGFTFIELLVGLAVTALCMTSVAAIFSSAVNQYLTAGAEKTNLTVLSRVDTLVSNDVHSAVRVNTFTASQLIIVRASGETVTYRLSLNGNLLRQVNGLGGEIVAFHVHIFTVSSMSPQDIEVQLGVKTMHGEEICTLAYSTGYSKNNQASPHSPF